MDHSPIRVNFDLGKKNKIYHHSWKEHLGISKIAKFGFEMFSNAENIALQSLQILYIYLYKAQKSVTILANGVTNN